MRLAADLPGNPNQMRTPCGYICPMCREETFLSYKPFCGNCGSRMPSELKLQAMGLVNYAWDYGRPIRDIKKIAEFLREVGATNFWLEGYRPSFRTCEIRFKKSDENIETLALCCVWTEHIRMPIGNIGWRGTLSLFDDHDRGCRLVDIE